MRPNSISNAGERRRIILIVLGAVLLTVLGIGLSIGYTKLSALYLEQCVITDREHQVTVHTNGQNIKTGLVLELFNLTNGNNLAAIDFREKRDEILANYPAIRDISIRLLPPCHVEISVEERDPIARLSFKGNTSITRVVDTDGVVFPRSANRSTLPVILENKDDITPVGKKLTGRRLAALRLIEHCQSSEFASIGLLDVDVTHLDYLKATLGNYDTARIAWEGMNDQLPGSAEKMKRQMRNLHDAVKSNTANSSSSLATHPEWRATLPGICTADLKEPIQ